MLRVSAESAIQKQWMEQAWSYANVTPRTLAEAPPLAASGLSRGAESAAAKTAWMQTQRQVAGLGAGLQFVTGLYFLKDDILRASRGYTASREAGQ